MPRTYLEIAVKAPQVLGVFHYHLPPELEGKVQAGCLVEAPFGKLSVQGVVLRQVEKPEVADTRPVTAVVDPEAVITPIQITLAEELSEKTLSSLAACIDLMLPPGLKQMVDTVYQLNPDPIILERYLPELTAIPARLVKLLKEKGILRGRQIDQSFPRLDWRKSARPLVRKGLLLTHSILPPPNVHPKLVRTARLACPPEKAEAALEEMGKRGSKARERRQAVLHFLIKEVGPVDVSWVYASSGGKPEDLRYLAERGFIALGETETWRDPLAGHVILPSEPPPLTAHQKSVWEPIRFAIHNPASDKPCLPFLLHGVTGSGKTEIYLKAVEEVLRLGRQAIVLVPEIALTPQTVQRFVSRFPGKVGLAHHLLSTGERYDTWRRARQGLLSVVVGPRSALFTPFPELGLIVIDEFHEDSYYQSESAPTYHAREAAVIYARLANAVCLLGSATPDITSRFQAETGGRSSSNQAVYHYLRLPARILAHKQVVEKQVQKHHLQSKYRHLEAEAETIELPEVRVVDMRQELKAGVTSIFSRALLEGLEESLANKQQAILFLNRRGTATYVFCRDCGYNVQCPRCDLPLTSHIERTARRSPLPSSLPLFSEAASELVCHMCGYSRKVPTKCPQCGSQRIRQYGTGTEKVVDEVRRFFPQARTLRWDYDTTRQKGSHEIILSHFANQRADILVGTQMIAKGLDLPLVTLVGAVLADVGLSLPDYRASEKAFQILTQVAGRAGRSPLGGKAVFQTFQPEHYVIQAAAGHDYETFYRKELEYRRKLRYPPFGRLVRLEFSHPEASMAEEASRRSASRIQSWIVDDDRRATEMIGPAPSFFYRRGAIYHWHIILRGPDPVSLLKGRQIGDCRIEVDPVSLL
jgi:primosomal protein N' (replication factor Y) (superfamily II helicase)